MQQFFRVFQVGLLAFLLCGASARALTGDTPTSPDTDFSAGKDEPVKPKQKEPSWFHRPSKSTPAEQLAYAESLRKEGRLRKAGKQFRALVHEWHNSPEGPKAQLAFAQVLEERGKYPAAFEEYQYLVDFYVGQFPYEQVMEHQFQIARQIMTSRRMAILFLPGFDRSQEAQPLFEKIEQNAPNWDRAAEALLFVGLIHEQNGNYDEAVFAYEDLLYHHPENSRARQASYRRAYCLRLLAEKRNRDEDTLRRTLSALAAFLRDYPDAPEAAEAQKDLDRLNDRLVCMYFDQARFYDTLARKPEAALKAYKEFVRQFPLSVQADQARSRIRELEEAQGKGQNEKK